MANKPTDQRITPRPWDTKDLGMSDGRSRSRPLNCHKIIAKSRKRKRKTYHDRLRVIQFLERGEGKGFTRMFWRVRSDPRNDPGEFSFEFLIRFRTSGLAEAGLKNTKGRCSCACPWGPSIPHAEVFPWPTPGNEKKKAAQGSAGPRGPAPEERTFSKRPNYPSTYAKRPCHVRMGSGNLPSTLAHL